MSTIIPTIRCVSNAKQIAAFYLKVFPNSRLISSSPLVVEIEIFGTRLAMLNGGEHATPNPSISFSLRVKSKKLTKTLRDDLSEGGEVLMEYDAYDRSPGYGRCNDRYGVSRQVMYDDREETTDHAMIPSLMFTHEMVGRAEEAMDYYCDVFPASGINGLRRYKAGGEDIEGTINHGEFTLSGQQFIAMDSAMDHGFMFDDGVSLMVLTDGQEQTDQVRNALVADGGEERECGWCSDRFGVSRQVIPKQLSEYMGDHERADEVIENLMEMKKIVITDLLDASKK